MNAIRFVPTGVHAYFDYIGGIVLLAAPFIFGFFSMGGPAVIFEGKTEDWEFPFVLPLLEGAAHIRSPKISNMVTMCSS